MLIDEIIAGNIQSSEFVEKSLFSSAHSFIVDGSFFDVATDMWKAINWDIQQAPTNLPSSPMWLHFPKNILLKGSAIDSLEMGVMIAAYKKDPNEDHWFFAQIFRKTPYCIKLVYSGFFKINNDSMCLVPDRRFMSANSNEAKKLGLNWGELEGQIKAATQKIIISALCVISAINSPRIAYIEPEKRDLARLNSTRIKQRKHPLIEHHTIRILPSLMTRIKQDREIEREAEGRRLHFRRGHFKARKTGMFWWSPHYAGDKNLGVIEKDYVVGA